MQWILYINKVAQPSPLYNSGTLITPKRNPLPLAGFPFSPSLQSLADASLFSVSMDLPNLHINWIIEYRAFCVWLSLNGFKVYPCCSVYQHFIPFYGGRIFHCMDIPHFAYLFISWRTLGLFPLFGSYEWHCYEHLCSSFCKDIFILTSLLEYNCFTMLC